MDDSIRSAVNGALFQEMRLNVLTNNIANLNTVGFKEDRTAFRVSEESLTVEAGSDDIGTADSEAASSYVSPVETYINFDSGRLEATGNPLDLALEGDGFFCLQGPEGEIYTRNGVFSLNAQGMIVAQDGTPLLGSGGPISLGGGRPEIDPQGNILVNGAPVDTIKVVQFGDMAGLKKSGGSTFVPLDDSYEPDKAQQVQVRQGFVEHSNVDAVKMMTEMIDALRGYESYQKIIQFQNDATLKAINEVGQLA